MSYLIDTNVLSELRRPKPDESVVSWFAQRPASTLFLSVLTLGELRKGIEALPPGDRRFRLLDWLGVDLPAFFSGRILSIDQVVVERWGRLLAEAGRPLPAIDSLLAATALQHHLCVVTRNIADFQYPGLDVCNPWQP